MKIFKNAVIFAVCFVVLLSTFCVSSFAQNAPNGGVYVFRQYWGKYWTVGETGSQIALTTPINTNNLVEGQYYNVAQGYLDSGDASGIVIRTDVLSSTGSVLFEAGKTYNYSFNGIIYANDVNKYNVVYIDWFFDYADGTNSGYHQITTSDCVLTPYNNYNNFRIDCTLTPQKDVARIWCRVYFRLASGSFYGGYQNVEITIDEVTLTNGLLDMIWGGIQNLFYTVLNIDDLTDSIKTSISSIQGFVVNTLSATLTRISNVIVGTDSQPGLVGQITGFFSDFVDTVVDFIQSIVTGEIIEDLHTLISGSLLSLPDLNSFTQAVSDYLIEEGNILKIIGEYDNFVSDFYDEINIGTQEIPFGIGKGLLVASACVTYISTEIPLVNELLYFSLAVGVVGFVLGSSWLVGKFISTHREEKTKF